MLSSITYEQQQPLDEHTRVAGIDIGIDNLAAVTSNLPQFQPFIVCGKALKSANRYYNKTKARLQSLLPENQRTSNRIQRLTQARNSKVDYYLHTASRFIVNQLVKQKITLLVIGKNDNWKQSVNLGRKTNQKFTAIPHATLSNQLIYKCQLAGIKAITVVESYTSKCSFLDLEPIKKHKTYSGKRIKRGLFCSRFFLPFLLFLSLSIPSFLPNIEAIISNICQMPKIKMTAS